MYEGVGKSGSPAPKPTTGRPAAFRALARASTARVADSAMAPIRWETRFFAEAVMFPSSHCRPGVRARVPRKETSADVGRTSEDVRGASPNPFAIRHALPVHSR